MIQVILFVLTFLTTFMVGEAMSSHSGLVYAVPLMLILGCHEGGHYIMCRIYGVKSTPPNFIPAPFGPFGTFGAVIMMKDNLPSRRALFDIGIAGPLAGFAVALPCVIVGLYLSELVPPQEVGEQYMQLGEPLLFKIVSHAMYGEINGKELMLHPVGYAGWIGLLVTALNLFPAGQLDGGHIAYAVFGPRVSWFFWPLIAGLVGMSLYFWSFAYLLFLVLLVILARHHPPPSDDVTPLDLYRKGLAVVPLIVLVLCFTPVPIRLAGASG